MSGADTKKLSSVYLNRGRFIILLTFIPICGVLLNIDKIMVGLGQDKLTSMYIREYVVGQIPGLIAQA